jgi:hypothetical protein
MYKYKIKDSDGDVTTLEFEFDFVKGRMVMEEGFSHIVAAKSYPRMITKSDVEMLLEAVTSEEKPDINLDEGFKTLLVMIVDEWCDSASDVHNASSLFELSRELANTSFMMRCLADITERKVESTIPRIRTDDMSYMWDAFIFTKEYTNHVTEEQIAEAIKDIREKYDFDEEAEFRAFSGAMLDYLGFWVLPVKVFDDLDPLVLKVPANVMEDLYKDWKKIRGEDYDDEYDLPVNVTNEINELIRKFNKSL